MRKYFVFALLCAALMASAQPSGKLSSLVQRYAMQYQTARTRAAQTGVQPEDTLIPAFVKLAPGTDESLLKKYGCRVLTSAGNIYIAVVPASQVLAMTADDSVVRIEAEEPAKPIMDTTHIIVAADKLQPEGYQAAGLPQAFTGKGIVMGITDSGFDYTHPMFRDAEGKSRIKQAWDIFTGKGAGYGKIGSLYQQDELVAVKHSPENSTCHGSHVMGIAAGSQWQGYRGIAFESDIVAANMSYQGDSVQQKLLKADLAKSDLSALEDFDKKNVARTNAIDFVALKYVLDYAEEHKQPCVVNCSWTGQTNFSNAYSAQEEFVNSLTGPGRIVVAGVGNDGDTKTYEEKEASETVYKRKLTMNDTEAFINIAIEAPFKVQFVIEGLSKDTLNLPSETIEQYNKQGLTTISTLDYVLLSGTAQLQCEADMVPGNLSLALRAPKALLEEDNEITFILRSDKAARINTTWKDLIFAEKQINSPYTIGAPASFKNVVGVGATAFRQAVRNSSGIWLYENGNGNTNPMGKVISWSGTGPTLNGLMKPDVVAPGYRIVSAYNNFLNKDCDEYEESTGSIVRTDKYDIDGQEYSLMVMDGTSMATPVTSGVIALWLQADPTLTPQRIKEVISRTATHLDNTLEYPNNIYGHGQIDAYKGLLDILNLTGIQGLSQSQPAGISFSVNGDMLTAEGAADGTAVTIYNLQGAIVRQTIVQGGIVSLSGLQKGVYAVQLGQLGSTLIRK